MSKNIPFTHQQVTKLEKGFTPSGYGPNRRRRRNRPDKFSANHQATRIQFARVLRPFKKGDDQRRLYITQKGKRCYVVGFKLIEHFD